MAVPGLVSSIFPSIGISHPTLDPGSLVIAIGAFLALFRWKLGMLKTLALSAAAGIVWFLAVR